jgi:hypothetical protein
MTGRRQPLLALAAGLLALVGAAQALALPRAWSPPVALTPAPTVTQGFHDAVVALNAAGDAVAGWQRDNAGCCAEAGTIQVRGRSGPRGAWGRPATLSRSPGSRLMLAINDRGDAVASWSEADGVHVRARAGLGGAWTEEALTAPAPSGAVGGALTLDPAGRAVLTLVVTTPGAVAVRTLQRPGPGQPWQAAPDLAAAGVVRIAVAPSGAAVAVSSPPAAPGAVSRRNPVSLAWEPALPIVPSGVSAAAAAVNDRGDALVAWTLPAASSGGLTLPGLTQVARRPPEAAAWTGPAAVGTIPGLLSTASLNVSGQGLLAWATQIPELGNAAMAGFGDVRVGTWSESVASSLPGPLEARAALDDRGRVVALLHDGGGPGGRGPSYGLAPPSTAGWGAQQAWPECVGFAPRLVVEQASGRAAATCERPEDGAPITIRSFDDLGPLALGLARSAAPGAKLAVRFSAPFAGTLTASVGAGGRGVTTVAVPVKEGYGTVTLTVPTTRARYVLRATIRATGRTAVSDQAPVTVR